LKNAWNDSSWSLRAEFLFSTFIYCFWHRFSLHSMAVKSISLCRPSCFYSTKTGDQFRCSWIILCPFQDLVKYATQLWALSDICTSVQSGRDTVLLCWEWLSGKGVVDSYVFWRFNFWLIDILLARDASVICHCCIGTDTHVALVLSVCCFTVWS
jgi:hypothetical protein